MRLTERAHHLVSQHIVPGSWAVDATTGNGHDTKFLAELVGLSGHVFAFDLQAAALATTARRLENLAKRVTLINACHSDMKSHLPHEAIGRIRAVMFNLGYLPGSDKRIITTANTTRAALDQALALLEVGGIVSTISYRGHPDGAHEGMAVEAWFRSMAANYDVQAFESTSGKDDGPILFTLANRP